MKKTLCWLGRITLFSALFTSAAFADEPFSSAPWLADLDAIEHTLAERYPSLEWHVQRGVDLRAVDQRARGRLAAATDVAAAKRALELFLRPFGDGHMSLTWPMTVKVVHVPESVARPKMSFCEQLGFRADADTTAIARDLPGYESLEGGPVLSSGIFQRGSVRVAVLRVREFTPDTSMCEAAVAARHVVPDACDDSCAERVRADASNRFLASIARQMTLLRAREPAALLVDVAGNGGGNDTAVALARLLGGEIPAPRMFYARTPEHLADLGETLAKLQGARAKTRGDERAFIDGFIASLRAATAPAPACDRMPLWRDEKISCSGLISQPFYAAGLSERSIPSAYRTRVWAPLVSFTVGYDELPRLWTGPLAIVVDGNTASAAELLAAMLQDAGAAKIIGAPTFGAGCGWTLPKHTTVLPNSGASLDMPDCLRLRRDDSNELDGIQPDILVGFRQFDSPAQRARRLQTALQNWPAGDARR